MMKSVDIAKVINEAYDAVNRSAISYDRESINKNPEDFHLYQMTYTIVLNHLLAKEVYKSEAK